MGKNLSRILLNMTEPATLPMDIDESLGMRLAKSPLKVVMWSRSSARCFLNLSTSVKFTSSPPLAVARFLKVDSIAEYTSLTYFISS